MQRVDHAQYTVSAFLVALAVLGTQACLPDFDVASSGGAGGMGGGDSGGSGGAGGAGASPVCEPMSELACYSGIVGTEGLGICTLGAQVCDIQGEYGPCTGSGSPKLESCSSPEDENCDGKPGCVGDCMWTHRFEKNEIKGYSSHAIGIGDLAVDPWWNTIMVGGYDEGLATGSGPFPLDLGGGDLNCSAHCGFAAKFDPQGEHMWSVPLENHAAESVALLSNGDMVVVARSGTSSVASVCGLMANGSPSVVVIMLDAAGHCKPGWGVRFPAKPMKRPSVVADAAGNIYVAFAAESGKVGSTPVGGQSVLVRLDPAGSISAVETFGGDTVMPVALAVDPGGEDVYLLGDGTGEIVLDANTALSLTYRDIFVAKYVPSTIGTANGPWDWVRSMGAQLGNGAYAGDMVVTRNGKVFVAGTFGTTLAPGGDDCGEIVPEVGSELLIAQLNTHFGECLGIRSFGATGLDGAETNQYLRLQHDSDYKHFVIGGPYKSPSLFKKDNGDPGLPAPVFEDIFVAKLDDKLEPVWVRGFGAQHADLVYGLAVDSGGSIRLAGVGRGVDFGCGAASDEEGNFFVTRLSP